MEIAEGPDIGRIDIDALPFICDAKPTHRIDGKSAPNCWLLPINMTGWPIVSRVSA